ncbi:VWA domain-containing protein [Actinomadura sp. 3N508]|uniref:VWA domain-containing protein n=1 Tax=Actinomadura sp. 3N508 TaxID=3375153 RepID=UPI0037C141AD
MNACANATIRGTNGDDRLTGTDGDDIIAAGNGNDIIDGGRGNDVICGDVGNDRLIGGPGDDKLYGGDGADTLRGGSGNDSSDGGKGKDACTTSTTSEKFAECESCPPDPGFTTKVSGSRNAKATVRSEDRIPKFELGVRSDYFRSRIALTKRVAFTYEFNSDRKFAKAEITIPYFPKAKALRGGGNPHLRIYGYDDKYGLWYRMPGKHKVDTKNHTVTATVSHFSQYSIFPEDPRLSTYWETKPVWCLAKDDQNIPNFDVSFVVGGSAGMAARDPDGKRVEAAKKFVDAMRAADQASVIGFNDTATTHRGLTKLDNPGNIGLVKEALDKTKTATGGNNLDEAVKAATRELTVAPGRGRPRVAVLISDGSGPLSDTTVNEAREKDIAFYTVGFGDSDTRLLESIASSTGGRFLKLKDAAQLPELYTELARDLIDDGTDTDADGVTDCVERRGALTAHGVYADDQPFKTGRYVRTDPTKADTDGDSLSDGAELGPQLDLRAKPELAEQYKFLVDAGITRFFNPTSNPADEDTDREGLKDAEEKQLGTNAFIADTDRDGATDYEEVRARVTDPTEPNGWIWAGQNGDGGPAQIPGLDPLTLVKPDANNYPWEFDILGWATQGDRKGDCDVECKEIYDWAQEEYSKKGWLCKLLTTCQPDDIRKEWINQAVDVQALFTYDDGHLRPDYVRDHLADACQALAARPEECFSETIEEKADKEYYYQDLPQALAEILSVIPGGVRPPRPDIQEAQGKLDKLAKQACAEVPRGPGQSAQSWGKQVHARFDELVRQSGDATLFGETGYLNGNIVNKIGTRFPKGTTAPDAGFGTPQQPEALFDLKTGEKGITAKWLRDLVTNLKGIATGVPVFKLIC